MSKRVAIVGAGLTGLTAAHILDQLGYGVTLFEALPFVGGKLSIGIPNAHLAREDANAFFNALLRPSIQVQLCTEIGRDLSFEAVRTRFDALLLAVGAWHSLLLGIPGEEILDGVLPAMHFLKQYYAGHAPQLKGRVAVAGGSIMTIHVARLAMQVGAHEVHVFFPGNIAQLPVTEQERAEAIKEGIAFHPHLQIKSILGTEDVNVQGLRCQRTRQKTFEDEHGGEIVCIPGSDCWYDVDTLLVAVGETPDVSFLPPQWRYLWRNVESYTTVLPGIYAAGNAVKDHRISKEREQP